LARDRRELAGLLQRRRHGGCGNRDAKEARQCSSKRVRAVHPGGQEQSERQSSRHGFRALACIHWGRPSPRNSASSRLMVFRRTMKVTLSIALVPTVLLLCSCAAPQKRPPSPLASAPTPKESRIVYPKTRAEKIVDTIFGTPVSDPYRWL